MGARGLTYNYENTTQQDSSLYKTPCLQLRIRMGCAPDGRASRARAGQAEDDARAIGEHKAAALALGHAAIHRVGVAEVVRGGQLVGT